MFMKLQNAAICCLSAWKNSALAGQIFMKFDIQYLLNIYQDKSSFIKI